MKGNNVREVLLGSSTTQKSRGRHCEVYVSKISKIQRVLLFSLRSQKNTFRKISKNSRSELVKKNFTGNKQKNVHCELVQYLCVAYPLYSKKLCITFSYALVLSYGNHIQILQIYSFRMQQMAITFRCSKKSLFILRQVFNIKTNFCSAKSV